MEITQHQNEHKGYFLAKEEDGEMGRMTFTMAGKDKMIIDHTEVNPKYKGMGIGYKLVKSAIAFARENSIRVIPLCPFAKSVIDRRPEFRDVLL